MKGVSMRSLFYLKVTATLLFAAASAMSQPITGLFGGVAGNPLASQIKYVDYFGTILPVNGLKNYVFYYDSNSPNKFLGPTTSTIRYLSADFNEIATGPTASYNPDPFYLTGTPVPPNPSDPYNTNLNYATPCTQSTCVPFKNTPPGISGVIRNSDGSPVFGTLVRLYSAQGTLIDEVRTNGNGVYIFYYINVPKPPTLLGNLKGFLPAGTYSVTACGTSRTNLEYITNTIPENNATKEVTQITVQPIESGFCLN
jgi:hypothetical protein